MAESVTEQLAQRLTRLAQGLRDGPPSPGEAAVLEAEAWMFGADDLARAVRPLRGLLGSTAQLPADAAEELARLLEELADRMATRGLDEEARELCQQIQDTAEAAQPVAEAPEAMEGEYRWAPPEDEAMVEAFLQECRERLEALSDQLLELEASPEPSRLVDEIFRNLHTLKGSSAFVQLEPLNRIAHAAEDLMGSLRASGRTPTRSVIDTLLAARDTMEQVVELAASRQPITWALVEQTLARLANPTESTPEGSRADVGVKAPGPRQVTESTIRVAFEKLDQLLNSVGELVVVRSGLAQCEKDQASLVDGLSQHMEALGRGQLPLEELEAQADRLVRVAVDIQRDLEQKLGRLQFVASKLRDEVMELRMVPMSRVFSKTKRTVRDLANRLGKSVVLEIEGEDTTVDKHIVERLDEPIVHLIRNALDHGLEDPEERRRLGKPPQGRIRLAARHEGSLLVVEVADDGRGIDPEAIRDKLVSKGWMTQEEAARTDPRILYEYLFRPGFSTAERVTELSGRGVGLDAVAQVLRELRGTVTVESQLGAGTRFRITLPLTLAIRQVLLARVGGHTVAMPLEVVVRTVPWQDELVRQTTRGRFWTESTLVPVVDLSSVLGIPPAGAESRHLVFVRHGDALFALECQELIGRQEILVKRIEGVSGDYPFVAGATLIDDRVIPILDVAAVVRWYLQYPSEGPPEPTREPSASDRRALVVDDSPPARSALATLLRELGFEVLEAEDGTEALKKAADTPVDLVCTDVLMPNMDGYELTRALRLSDRYRAVPIVMVSVRGEKVDMVRGFDAGVDAYLTKPVDRASLERTVSRLLGRQPAQEVDDGG